MIHASLFSGIGGPEVAAAMLGWENAFHCEINPFGRAVLEYWFPDSESYDDITKTDFHKWRGKINVLTGGFPCQPFSYAGKRGGREDERYLWPEMLRVIDEVRPTWVVGENVAGITTMVEGGVLTPMGSDTTLFGEGDGLHRYELRQSFTIERICRDLEGLGYSVQPMLIPAAAVGAPHRRDRIFILAYASDSDRRDDVRTAGGNEGEGEGEGIQERHSIRKPGEPDQLRSEIQGTAQDSICDGRGQRDDDQQGRERNERDTCSGNTERLCAKEGIDSSHANCQGREEPQQSGGREDSEEDGTGLDNRTERYGCNGDFSNSVCKGLERENESGDCESRERMQIRRDSTGYDWKDLRPEGKWADFPTVSPVHAGNDGIPIRMDGASIPFTKWRTEALKAYGNAIVPQVMYRIFQAIEAV